MNGRWWMHPGLWMMVGALAYPAGMAAVRAIAARRSGIRPYAFGA